MNANDDFHEVTAEELRTVEGGSLLNSMIDSVIDAVSETKNLLKKFAQTADLITGNMK